MCARKTFYIFVKASDEQSSVLSVRISRSRLMIDGVHWRM